MIKFHYTAPLKIVEVIYILYSVSGCHSSYVLNACSGREQMKT